MPDEIGINASGDIFVTAAPVIIKRDIFLGQFADRRIAFLKNKEKQLLKIQEINKSIADEDKEITDLYKKIILKIDKAEKDKLKSNASLYDKLSHAFPDHFEEYTQSITAEA